MTTPEIRAIIAQEMNRLADTLKENAPLCVPTTELAFGEAVYAIRSTFPLPSTPVLPAGVKWFEENGWGHWASLDGEWYWRHKAGVPAHVLPAGWCRLVGVSGGNYNGDSLVANKANPPTSPPPNYIAPTTPLPAKVGGDGCDHNFKEVPGSTSGGNVEPDYACTKCGKDLYAHMNESDDIPLPPKDNKCESSEPVASGEPSMPPLWPQHYFQKDAAVATKGLVELYRDQWRAHLALTRSIHAAELTKLRLSLSQSQHEAEKAKGEIARLQSELAGVRGRMEAAEKVCGLFGEWDASRPANYSPAWYALKAAHSAWLSSRPLAPAEVKK